MAVRIEGGGRDEENPQHQMPRFIPEGTKTSRTCDLTSFSNRIMKTRSVLLAMLPNLTLSSETHYTTGMMN